VYPSVGSHHPPDHTTLFLLFLQTVRQAQVIRSRPGKRPNLTVKRRLRLPPAVICRQNASASSCPRVTLLQQKSGATHTSSDIAPEKISKLRKLTHERLTEALLRRQLPSYAAQLAVYVTNDTHSH